MRLLSSCSIPSLISMRQLLKRGQERSCRRTAVFPLGPRLDHSVRSLDMRSRTAMFTSIVTPLPSASPDSTPSNMICAPAGSRERTPGWEGSILRHPAWLRHDCATIAATSALSKDVRTTVWRKCAPWPARAHSRTRMMSQCCVSGSRFSAPTAVVTCRQFCIDRKSARTTASTSTELSQSAFPSPGALRASSRDAATATGEAMTTSASSMSRKSRRTEPRVMRTPSRKKSSLRDDRWNALIWCVAWHCCTTHMGYAAWLFC